MVRNLIAALIVALAAGSDAEPITRFVLPQATDPAIDPVELPNAEGVALPTHFVATDPTAASLDRLFLWLPGSGGAPTQYQALLSLAARLGYDSAGLVYDSWPPVNDLTTNSTDPDLPEAIRRERLFGEDLAPDPISVDVDNSIVNRAVRLLEHQAARHPDERWGSYLTPEGTLDWSRVVVGGHSQGAGHTTYLSKEFPLSGGVLLAGPGDFVSGFGTAPWLFEPGATPADRLFALTHVGDPTAAGFFANQRILGLDDFGPLQNVDGRRVDELTSHMLTSTLDTGDARPHSAIAVDDLLPLDENGAPVYLAAWTSLLERAAVGPPPAGDYNADGRVDSADYTVWRDTLGETGLNLPADGDRDGDVDEDDYRVWLAGFGAADVAAATRVPEPTGAWLVGLVLTAATRSRRA